MDPNQVTQVFQRCPACRTPVSPTDPRCPSCGRSLQDVVETTMPMPRLDADADPIAPDATVPLPRLGNTAAPAPAPPPIADPETTMPLPTARPAPVARPVPAPEPRAVYAAPPRPTRRGFPIGLLLFVLLVGLAVLVYLALARAAGVSVPLGPALGASGAPPANAPTASTSEATSQWVVANTGGEGVYLRRTPRLDDRLVAWPDNTPMQDLGEEATGDGLAWRKVRDPRGNVGYVPTQWLAARQ